jgi:hypothetical protein
MSTYRFLPNEYAAAEVKASTEADKGLLAWGSYRSKKFANFTRELYDFPNATVSISVGASAGWLEQLAGITNVSVGVISGTHLGKQIRANEVVGTGIFFEGTQRVSFGQAAYEGFQSGYFAGNAVYVNPESIKLLGDVQQITMVEPVDAAALAQVAVTTEHSLMVQLRRIRDLPDCWDGEEAQRISEAAGKTGEAIIKLILQIALSFLAVPTTRLGPLPDGSLRFESTHSNKELFLTVSDNAIEIQAWQPLDATESVGYWNTDAEGAREHLEWLVK